MPEIESSCGYCVVQSLSRIWLFVTPWSIACQAPLSSTGVDTIPYCVSWSLLKFMSIESVMLSNYLILWLRLFLYPQSFPASGSFAMSWLFASGSQSITASASVTVILGLLAVSSPTLVFFKSISSSTFSFLYSPTLISIHHYWKIHSFHHRLLCHLFNMLSRFVIAFLLRSKPLSISWL